MLTWFNSGGIRTIMDNMITFIFVCVVRVRREQKKLDKENLKQQKRMVRTLFGFCSFRSNLLYVVAIS